MVEYMEVNCVSILCIGGDCLIVLSLSSCVIKPNYMTVIVSIRLTCEQMICFKCHCILVNSHVLTAQVSAIQ